MKEYRLNKKFLCMLIGFVAVIALAAKAVIMLFLGDVFISAEKNREISAALGTVILIISCSYLYSVIMMVRQYAVHKGNACTITEEGITNTFVAKIIVSFFIVAPIKEIPWNAVLEVKEMNGMYVAKLDAKEVKAGFFARFLLKWNGYPLGEWFTADELMKEPRIIEKMAAPEEA